MTDEVSADPSDRSDEHADRLLPGSGPGGPGERRRHRGDRRVVPRDPRFDPDVHEVADDPEELPWGTFFQRRGRPVPPGDPLERQPLDDRELLDLARTVLALRLTEAG